jgi:hypothetical protein
VSLKACTVVVHDLNDTAHSLDVSAETLYEAVAQALAAVKGHEWAADIGRRLTTVTVAGAPKRTLICRSRLGCTP